jgi:biotin carboxyl carrier protein
LQRNFTLTIDDVPYSIVAEGNNISVDGRSFTVEITAEGQVLVDGIAYEATLADKTAIVDDRAYTVQVSGLSLTPSTALDPAPPPVVSPVGVTARTGADSVVAIMPGKIVRVLVEEGQTVVEGQPVCVLEAMKMENEMRAHRRGVVRAVHIKAGEDVEKGQALVEIASA